MMNSIRQGGNKLKKSSSKHLNSNSNSHSKQKAPVDNPLDSEKLKENVTVTVRFRPLSVREIRQGEEIAWYADGDTIVRNENTSSIAYAFDQVFGPTSTTRQVYDIAARHVVSGAMEGINGTIFAYGVTSSGKTHTMHGDQRSPGIIPLAVKDAFSIIQETPRREFLLRLSYMEIYNEVVNDLLNPAGQHLRIREDGHGTFVEGIKEEVVLSPGHALSVIAAGEEQRHVGSTNFNIHSSRSHTIFTLTIESSPWGEDNKDEAVNLSQLNLIDLAGSESSKAETVGIRRKEGSYINKSLLTLGTVISKLTDGKTSHIPYRDSKLTRLLQSSLSGHGRTSLICTVTPSSSNSEETHNTLKFAHRAKHIEIKASQNKIIDEKSLIKTYQSEIRSLKEELEQLKSDTDTVPELKHTEENDVLLKEELEDGQVKQQSISDQEEAKAALLSQIQNLTKLILVSTKSSNSSTLPHHPAPGSRYSFGEEELAYLPHRRQDLSLDDENILLHITLDGGAETKDALKEDKKIKKTGLLNWLKPRKRESTSKGLTSASDKSSGAKSASTPSSPAEYRILPMESRHSYSTPPSESTSAGFLSEARQSRETNKDAFLQQEAPPASIKTSDQIDVLRVQQRILSIEVANHFTALKRLSEEATGDGNEESIKRVQVEMAKLNDEIKRTNKQISLLENQATNSVIPSLYKMDDVEQSRSVSMLEAQLNEMSIELKAQAMKNQVIQELLDQKNNESIELKETVTELKQEVPNAHDLRNPDESNKKTENTTINDSGEGLFQQAKLHTETENTTINDSRDVLIQQAQVLEIEQLKQKVATLTESKEQLEAENRSLLEECSYAKELAAAAATELNALSEEVMKLMGHNERLQTELLTTPKNSTSGRKTMSPVKKKQGPTQLELKRELAMSKERELAYEAILSEKYKKESELQQTVKELKQRETYLETEVANMWLLVERLKKVRGAEINVMESE